ncbi:MAG: hypothetical protein ACTSWN_02110 [Promethearchaeota archaeon]
MREILEEKMISIPEVKELLDKVVEDYEQDKDSEDTFDIYDYENAGNYFMKSTYEYVTIFSKIDAEKARKVINTLVKEHDIPLNIAIQIVNILPETIDELALFFDKGPKKLTREEIEKLLYVIRETLE